MLGKTGKFITVGDLVYEAKIVHKRNMYDAYGILLASDIAPLRQFKRTEM